MSESLKESTRHATWIPKHKARNHNRMQLLWTRKDIMETLSWTITSLGRRSTLTYWYRCMSQPMRLKWTTNSMCTLASKFNSKKHKRRKGSLNIFKRVHSASLFVLTIKWSGSPSLDACNKYNMIEKFNSLTNLQSFPLS